MSLLNRLWLIALRTINRRRFGLRVHFHYSEHGSLAFLESGRECAGPTLVFLHGLGASKDQWGPEILAMGRRYHCLFVDLPGHGQSTCKPPGGFGPKAAIPTLDSFLRQHGQQNLVLIGSSLGGCLAGVYTATFPQRVKQLVALAPAGLGEEAFGPAIRSGIASGMPIFGYRTVQEMLSFWEFVFEHPPRVGKRLSQALAESGRERFVSVQRVLEDFTREGLRQLTVCLPAICAPTLVVWGRCDRIFSVDALDRVVRCVPSAQGIAIDDAGHACYLDRGRKVVEVIEQFLLIPDE
jgi:pimeloyl-ACP methyl ester carboxylesterase